MTLYKKLLSHWLLLSALVVIGILSYQLNQAKIMSVVNACTWVTTSCGSGCADNKDLYNCSTSVQVQTVTVSDSNPDSNNKAQYVAPAVVTQYIPPVEPSTIQYSGVESVANSAAQQASSTTTYTDQTGQGGEITQSTGANLNQINAANVSSYGSSEASTTETADGNFYCAPNSICAGSVKSGGAPFVVGCDCNNDGKTDRQLAVNTVTGNQAAAYCSQVVCSASGATVTWGGQTYQKSCEPGSQMCAGGGKAYVCKDDGTGFHDIAVNSHACGYIGCGSGPGYEDCGKTNFCSLGYRAQAEQYCLSLGSVVSPVFVDGCYKCNVPTPTLKDGYSSRFIGCKSDDPSQNCYEITYSGGKKEQKCYYEPGLSCGVTKVSSIPTPLPTTTTVTTTSSSPPPPAAPQCISIASSKSAPKIGDQVTFTCDGSPSDLVVRYEFRYAVSTGEGFSSSTNFQSVQPAQGTPTVSTPITISKVGEYLAQCRPCTANSCLDWEPAELN